MPGKGRGWHGESKRHSAAARGIRTAGLIMSTSMRKMVPARSVEGYVVVAVLDMPAGVSVRWAHSLKDAKGPTPAGDYQFLLPSGLPIDHYAVLEEDDEYVFLAVLLGNDHVSAKHRYLVSQRDWKRAKKASGGKSF